MNNKKFSQNRPENSSTPSLEGKNKKKKGIPERDEQATKRGYRGVA